MESVLFARGDVRMVALFVVRTRQAGVMPLLWFGSEDQSRF